jgi:hypothetical protein
MGIRPTDLPITPPREAEIVRRVERESEAQEFGQKEQSARREGRRRPGQEDAAPHDAVEVSVEYLTAPHPQEEAAPSSAAESEETAEPVERHLDIQA